ncbi:MAG: ABC transporter permease, partial [Pseudomonadota bacterium]
ESTFTVTLALNALTLAVAGFSLFTALLTLSNMRQPQLAPLWALGVTRRRLGWIELIRMLCLAAFSAVLAIPLGLLLAAILTKIINVEAFGWELPLFLFPEQWLRLVVLALLTAGLAALWPVLRLRRMPPADLIRVFSHER